MDELVCKVNENFVSLSKKVASHSALIKELENQIGLISVHQDIKPKCDSISGENINLQTDGQILAFRATDKKPKEEHVMDKFEGKMPNTKPKEWISQRLINKEKKEVECIVERMIDEGEFDKLGPVDRY